MTVAYPANPTGGARRDQEDAAAAVGLARWLGLAATPTFAIMALLTGVADGDVSKMLCAPAHDAIPLSGMTMMYLLMSAFHSAPWLKLISSRRREVSRS